jgi:hypothetical protein
MLSPSFFEGRLGQTERLFLSQNFPILFPHF